MGISNIVKAGDAILNEVGRPVASFDGRLAALLVEESRLAESASLRLTHDQLARHLGSAREVVSRGRTTTPRRGGIPARP